MGPEAAHGLERGEDREHREGPPQAALAGVLAVLVGVEEAVAVIVGGVIVIAIVAGAAVAGVVMPGVSVLMPVATEAVLGVRFACHLIPVATMGAGDVRRGLPMPKYKSSGLAHCV
jgi:hypothetical protein